MRHPRKLASLMMAALSLAWASEASADIACPFSVTAVSLDTWGNLAPTLTNNGTNYLWYFCSTADAVTVNNGYGNNGGVASSTCNAFFSQLLTAKVGGRTITLTFHGPNDCSSLPATGTWINPYPVWISF